MIKKKKIRMLFILVLLFLLLAALSRYLTPYDPYAQDLSSALQKPSAAHLFGTDRYGRDLFSRVIVGAQSTVFSALILVLITSVIGTVIGSISGYFGGVADTILMRISDIFLAFPGMVFAIAVAGVLAGGLKTAVLALVVISWPKYARMSRSQVLVEKEKAYFIAAKLSGTSPVKLIWRHLFPNIMGIMTVTTVLDIGTMIMEIASLSFLGMGATAPLAEWGAMMSNGRSMIQTSPWVVLAPGLGIFISVALFNLFGDALRDHLDPKGVTIRRTNWKRKQY